MMKRNKVSRMKTKREEGKTRTYHSEEAPAQPAQTKVMKLLGCEIDHFHALVEEPPKKMEAEATGREQEKGRARGCCFPFEAAASRHVPQEGAIPRTQHLAKRVEMTRRKH